MRHRVGQSTSPYEPTPPATSRARLLTGLIALGCLAVMGVAAWMTPSPAGIGTHCSLGLPPCSWVDRLDIPCPTCGMTTAFAHAADGHFLQSFKTQPLGTVIALGVAVTFWLTLTDTVLGSHLGRSMLTLGRAWLLWTIGILALLAWLYKIWVFK